MCYFVEINLPRQKLKDRFGLPMLEDPRYMQANFINAFTHPWLPVISAENDGSIDLSQWGLVPFWAKDANAAENIRNKTFNARSETVWKKPAFRAAIKYRRCMILAHGFFEWQHRKNNKIPYYIRLKDNSAFAFAGIQEEWTNKDTGEILNSCSVLTKKADPFMEKIHNTKKRMPVILNRKTENNWIDMNLSRNDIDELIQLSKPELEAFTIDKKRITGKFDPQNPEILRPCDYPEQNKLF